MAKPRISQTPYNELALEFLQNVLKSAKIPFDGSMTAQVSHSARYDYLEGLRHPKLDKDGKWFLDDLQLKNKSVIWIKLENQWLKGKVEIKGRSCNIVFEPENISIPISENLFLRW